MADVYEQNLPQKTNLTTNDYVRVVGSDDVSYKQPLSDVAQKTIENYAGSTLAGSTQSVKGAIDGLKSSATADKAELNASINEVASDLASESSTRASQDTNLQAQINQLVAPTGTAPNPAEIENARIGADNITYTTLGDAIRTQVTDLKSDLSDETSARILLAGRVTTAESDIDTLETHKVAQPLDGNNQPTNGTSGQLLRTRGNGATEWTDVGLPTDAQTAQAVSDWLDDHPEATTTVQDHSLTYQKLVNGTMGYVTPEMFGAKGDGITDDTQALKQTFANGNKSILLANNYKITDKVPVYSNTNIFGGGIIHDARTGSYENYLGLFHGDSCENVVFENVLVVGDGAGDEILNKVVFYFEHTENISIKHCEIKNIDSIWAVLFNECNHSFVESCLIENYSYGGVGNINDGNDFAVSNCSILNASTSNVNSYGIMLNGYDHVLEVPTYGGVGLSAINNYLYDENPTWEMIDAHGGTDITVIGNRLENSCGGMSIFNDINRNFYTKNVVVKNNIINCIDEPTIANNSSLVVGGENVVVSGNIVNYGGLCTSTATTNGAVVIREVDDGIISNNVILNSHIIGMRFTQLRNVVVEDNIIDSVVAPNSVISYGMIFGNGEYENVHVKSNHIKECNFGILNPSAFNNSHPYLKFEKNIFDDIANSNFGLRKVAGTIPQYDDSKPTWATTAKEGDEVLSSNLANDAPKGWTYTGSGWKPFGGIATPKKIYDNKLTVGQNVTLDLIGYTALMLLLNDASGDTSSGKGTAIIPVIAGSAYYPLQIGTTTTYVRVDITNGVLTFLGCGVSDKVIRIIYGL